MSSTILTIVVKTKSKAVDVKKIDDQTYLVKLTKPAHQGKANLQLIEVLSKHLNISPNKIFIESGLTSTTKRVIINHD